MLRLVNVKPPYASAPVRRPPSALEVWEEDGGVRALTVDEAPAVPALTHEALLERLGAALLSEWHRLPMHVQKAVYRRTVGPRVGGAPDAQRRQVALLLHAHMRGVERA